MLLTLLWVFGALVAWVVGTAVVNAVLYVAMLCLGMRPIEPVAKMLLAGEGLSSGTPCLINNVHGCLFLSKTNRANVEAVFRDVYTKHPEMVAVPVFPRFLWPYWARDKHFVLEDQVISYEEHYSHEQLRARLSELLSTPLPANRPLWEAHIFEDIGNNQSFFCFRLNHCLGDGYALLRMMYGACTDLPPPTKSKGGRTQSQVFGMLPKLPGAAVKLLFMQPDQPSALRAANPGPPTRSRGCDWAMVDCKVDELKQIIRDAPAKFTVNEVLSAATGRALALSCEARGKPLKTRPHAAVWASLCPMSEMYTPISKKKPMRFGCDKLGAVMMKMSTNTATPMAQLEESQRELRQLLSSPEPVVANKLMAVIGLLPYPLSEMLWHISAYKGTLSFSNIQGPATQIGWAKARIDGVVFLVPSQQNIGMFFHTISYNNRISVAVDADSATLNDQDITDLCHKWFPQALKDILGTLQSN
eukprot:m.48230 g.48230  ORF g.48230 m.48230 type:complete len:473 (+) comp11981_c0_seq1:102-1520(+)